MRHISAVLAFLLAAVLAACGSTSSTTPAAEGSEGSAPAKVVVLDYNTLDSLDTLGLGDRVVGVPTKTLPAHLKGYADKENVGTMQEPDMEKIASLEPEVILIGGRTLEKKAELEKIAKTVDMSVDAKNFMASFQAKSRELGEMFGKTTEVDEKLKAIDEQVAATKKKAEASDAKALIVLVSGGKLSAFGPGSRFGIIHDLLGVKAAAPDLEVDNHGQAISFEFIAKTNPDMMFVVDRDAAIGQQGKSAEQVLDNDLVAGTKAWTNKKVTYLDGGRWYLLGNGLGNFPEMLKSIDGALG